MASVVNDDVLTLANGSTIATGPVAEVDRLRGGDSLFWTMREGDTYEVTIPGALATCPRCGAFAQVWLRLDETPAEMEARATASLDGHECRPRMTLVITGLAATP